MPSKNSINFHHKNCRTYTKQPPLTVSILQVEAVALLNQDYKTYESGLLQLAAPLECTLCPMCSTHRIPARLWCNRCTPPAHFVGRAGQMCLLFQYLRFVLAYEFLLCSGLFQLLINQFPLILSIRGHVGITVFSVMISKNKVCVAAKAFAIG